MNVRCCCDASLVLGRLDLDWLDHCVSEIKFILRDGSILALPIEKAAESFTYHDGSVEHRSEWAIKSNNTPIDILRQIPGWHEVNRVIPPGSD